MISLLLANFEEQVELDDRHDLMFNSSSLNMENIQFYFLFHHYSLILQTGEGRCNARQILDGL